MKTKIEQLKGVANIQNPEYFGGIRVHFLNSSVNKTSIGINCGDNPVKIIAENGSFDIKKGSPSSAVVASEQTEYESDGILYIYPHVNNTNIVLISKYDEHVKLLGDSTLQNKDANEGLYYLDDINYSRLKGMFVQYLTAIGTLDFGTVPTLMQYSDGIRITANKNIGDLKILIPEGSYFNSSFNGLIVLDKSSTSTLLPSDYAELDISAFKNCSAIVNLKLMNGGLKVTGNLNTMLNNIYSAGKVSGTITINLSGTNVIFKPAGASEYKTLTKEDGQTNGYTITATFTSEGWTAVQS